MVDKLSADKYDHAVNHDYETWSGTIIVWLQLLIWIMFVLGCAEKLKTATDPQMQTFMRQLLTFGSIFMLALPILVTIVNGVVAPYVRHRVVTIGVLSFQLGAQTLFTNAIFTTKSTYFKASHLSKQLL